MYNFSCFDLIFSDCECLFIRYDRLERHIASGRSCQKFTEHLTAENLITTMYINSYGLGRSEDLKKNNLGRSFAFHLQNLPEIEVDDSLPKATTPLAPLSHSFPMIFSQGWALQAITRERKTFSRKQENFIESIFQEGRRNKKKTKPPEVVEMMRRNKIAQNGSQNLR